MSLSALRVCVLVEATAAMERYYEELRQEWLVPLLRGAKAAHGNLIEFGLILFRTAKYSDGVVQRSKWTTDVEEVCAWAENVAFTGGCFRPTALAEALVEMVYMCKSPHQFVGKTLQCHCVLLASSEPSRAPVHWPYACDTSQPGGSTTFAPIAKQLKANHNISVSMMQGGYDKILKDMFRTSSNYKEERRLQASGHLLVHVSAHWPEAVQWLVEKHGQHILPKPGITPPNSTPSTGLQGPPGAPPSVQSAQQAAGNVGGLQRATALPTSAQLQPQPMLGFNQHLPNNAGVTQIPQAMGQPGMQSVGGGTGFAQPGQMGPQGLQVPLQGQQVQGVMGLGIQGQNPGDENAIVQGVGGQEGIAGQGGQQAGAEAAKRQLVQFWQGTVVVSPKQAKTTEPMPLFVARGMLHADILQHVNLAWPPVLVIKKFVANDNVRTYFENMKFDITKAPKVFLLPTETKRQAIMQEMSNKNFAAIIDIPPNLLILRFRQQQALLGIIVPKSSGNM